MSCQIEVTWSLRSDFHVGTGMGLGRTIDDLCLRDSEGRATIPGSTIKGLVRDQMRILRAALPAVPEERIADLLGAPGGIEGAAVFDDARPSAAPRDPARLHGRSARDRSTGGPMKKALFHYEDAAAGTFESRVSAARDLAPGEIALLVTALRKIDALGGQRRRGKGQVEVTVRVAQPGSLLDRLELPDDGTSGAGLIYRRIMQKIERSAPDPWDRPEPPPLPGPRPIPGAPDRVTLLVVAEAAGPLAPLWRPQAGNVIDSLDHIPGTSLRGALARRLIHSGWHPSSDPFQRAFVRDQICFGPLYPARAWRGEHRSAPFPAPRSLITCSRLPGLRDGVARADQVHGLRDMLRARNPLATCHCGARMAGWPGWLQVRRETTGHALQDCRPERHTIQRTAIDPDTQRGDDGTLRATRRLPRRTWMVGYIWARRDLAEMLLATLGDDPIDLRVGKGRTRGQGALWARVLRQEPRHESYPLLLPAGHDPERPSAGDKGFALTLYSDLVAVDRLLRPLATLDPPALWDLLGGDAKSPVPFSAGAAFSGQREVAGFNGVPGLPRSPDTVIEAGSTWWFDWLPGTEPKAVENARRLLAKAQRHGLGLRRGEGFGRVIVDHPLHAAAVDQTRPGASHQVSIDCDTDLVDADSRLEPVAAGADRRPAPHSPVAVDIKASEREGFVRLLLELAQEPDPSARIDQILASDRGGSGGAKAVAKALKKLRSAGPEKLLATAARLASRES